MNRIRISRLLLISGLTLTSPAYSFTVNWDGWKYIGNSPHTGVKCWGAKNTRAYGAEIFQVGVDCDNDKELDFVLAIDCSKARYQEGFHEKWMPMSRAGSMVKGLYKNFCQ